MIYVTGDIHGEVFRVAEAVDRYKITAEDVIVILGDVGMNYYGNNHGDRHRKKKLNKLGVPVFCIHGNHEMRPGTIDTYHEVQWHGGTVYHVESFIDLYLNNAEREKLDPILDVCADLYKKLEMDEQIEFKSAAKSFVRTYGFLGAILPYGDAEWEKLSIFLNLLIPKLPSPEEDDLSAGVIEAIDLESYRAEAQNMMSIHLEDSDAEVDPVPTGKPRNPTPPELDLLTSILNTFNDMFGNIEWTDADNVRRQVAEIPAMVAKDDRYQNAMRNSDKQNARIESDRALQSVIFGIMADNMELFKQYQDNASFKKWLSDLVFNITYNPNMGRTDLGKQI